MKNIMIAYKNKEKSMNECSPSLIDGFINITHAIGERDFINRSSNREAFIFMCDINRNKVTWEYVLKHEVKEK